MATLVLVLHYLREPAAAVREAVGPDVALRIARQAPCSVLVVTVRPEA